MKTVTMAFVLAFALQSIGSADTQGQHARHMASSGVLEHDSVPRRENVYMQSYNGFGSRITARIGARVAWRNSPGHLANLPMIGLRVAKGPTGTYVVGRR